MVLTQQQQQAIKMNMFKEWHNSQEFLLDRESWHNFYVKTVTAGHGIFLGTMVYGHRIEFIKEEDALLFLLKWL